jgi:hypothetical protein
MSHRSLAAVASLLLLAVTLPALAGGQATFDPVAGPYTYVQPDPTGDGNAQGNVKFGDITSLAMAVQPDGSLLVQMKFVDLSQASGEMRYCVFFKVGATAYQTGYKGQLANGAPNGAATACTWSDGGTSVGTPTFDAANDQIRDVIAPDKIEGLGAGAKLTAINVKIGVVVPVAGAGQQDAFDTLAPSVEPKDFTYAVSGGETDELGLTLDVAVAEASASHGETASFAFSIKNNGTKDAKVGLATTGLPQEFTTTFEPESPDVPANGSKNVTLKVAVPHGTEPSEIKFKVNISAVGNFSLELPLLLRIVPARTTMADMAHASNETRELNETAEADGTPSVGLVPALAVLVVAVAAIGFRRRRS